MFDAGLVPNSRGSAAFNSARLSQAFALGKTPRVAAGYYYFAGAVTTPAKAGGVRIITDGGFGTDAGVPVTFHYIGDGPALRLRGNGAVFERIRWIGGGAHAIVEVEGRASPPTGRHRFRDCVFENATAAIRCLAGYYNDSGAFIADENHADMSILDGCETYNVGVFLQLENQQAVNWKLRDCAVNVLGGPDVDKAVCVVNAIRGGKVLVDGLTINHPRCTLLKTGKPGDFSPNNCRYVFRDVDRDLCAAHKTNHYLTLLECTDPTYAETILANLSVTAFIPIHTMNWDDKWLYRGVPEELTVHGVCGVRLLKSGQPEEPK